jgi:hypothetical protein
MQFEFDWDPAKAETNWRKHGVTFEQAMGIFSDPLARYRCWMTSLALARNDGLPWDEMLHRSCCWPFIPIRS